MEKKKIPRFTVLNKRNSLTFPILLLTQRYNFRLNYTAHDFSYLGKGETVSECLTFPAVSNVIKEIHFSITLFRALNLSMFRG